MKKKPAVISPLMRTLAAYIAAAPRRALPAAVTERAKHHLLDTLSAMLSGSRLLPGRRAIEFIKTQGGVPEANQLATFIDIQEVRALIRQQKINLPTRRASTVAQSSAEKHDKVETNKDMASNIPPKKEAEKPADPRESAAEGKLRNARLAFKVKDYDLAENFLKQIINDYSETKSVVEAKSMLDEIKKTKK